MSWPAICVFAMVLQEEMGCLPDSQRGCFTGNDLEREMFILRKLIEKERNNTMGEQGLEFYICSLSCTTIVYKVSRSELEIS